MHEALGRYLVELHDETDPRNVWRVVDGAENAVVARCGTEEQAQAVASALNHAPSRAPSAAIQDFVIVPRAGPGLRRLLAMISNRFEDEFTAEEFRAFRDSLSASGIDLCEIERFTESPRRVVL